MLFQPAIIALLLAASLSALVVLGAIPFAIQIIRRWDIHSGTEQQLALERKTYLFSTLISFVLISQLAALLLFVFNADRLSGMFIGAMCAVGTLNVNAWGFPALILQIVLFFLSATWLSINYVDSLARRYPLIRIKYALLLVLVPGVLANLWLQWQYFIHLKANVITSCCGSLFSEEAKTLSAEASALPADTALWLFYLVGCASVVINLWHVKHRRPASGYLAGGAAVAAFATAIVGILSFVSLYIYEHPHHHCPFCILKPDYDYQGYMLYLPLFLATAVSLSAGAIQPFVNKEGLQKIIPAVSSRLALVGAASYAAFMVLVSWFVLHSNLILVEH